MASSNSTPTGLKNFERGIDSSKTDARWSEYDDTIKEVVSNYNIKVANIMTVTMCLFLDWKIVKAILWTETGPNSDRWKAAPMQIGNPGDDGIDELLAADKGGALVMPAAYRSLITKANVQSSGKNNIIAGVGYLLLKAANSDVLSVEVPGSVAYNYPVKSGDNLSLIAKNNGTTLDELRALNPGVSSVLKIGTNLTIKKASMTRVITGWKRIDSAMVAKYYNTSLGDPLYAKKIDYCLSVINSQS